MLKKLLEMLKKIVYFIIKRILFFFFSLLIKFLWDFNFESMYSCVSCEDTWLYDVSTNITTDKYILAFGLLTFVGYKIGSTVYKYYKEKKNLQKLKHDEETAAICEGNLPKYPDLPSNSVMDVLIEKRSNLTPQLPDFYNQILCILEKKAPYIPVPFYKYLNVEASKFISRESFFTNPNNLSYIFFSDFVRRMENQVGIKNALVKFKDYFFSLVKPEKIDPNFFSKCVHITYSRYAHFLNRPSYNNLPECFKVFNPSIKLLDYGVLLNEPFKQVMRVLSYVCFLDLKSLDAMRCTFFRKLYTSPKYTLFKENTDSFSNLDYVNEIFFGFIEIKSKIVYRFLENIESYIILDDNSILEDIGQFLVQSVYNSFDVFLDLLNINFYDLNILLKFIDYTYSFLYNLFDPTKNPKEWTDFDLSKYVRSLINLFKKG